MTWELEFMLWIQNHLYFSWLKPVMIVFTYLGNAGIVWLGISAFLYFKKRDKKEALTTLLAILIAAVLANLVIKNIFMRPRPFQVYPYVDLLIQAPLGYSFPSGHTAASFAAALVLQHFYPKKAVWFWGLACIIAFSRIFLFVHFPTDVLAGCIIGMACGLLALEVYQRGFFEHFRNVKK